MAERRDHELGWHLADWSDFELRLVIELPPISWKRQHKVTRIGGHYSIGPTTKAIHWSRGAAWQMRLQWGQVFSAPIPKTIPLNLAVMSYHENARLIDASNLYQGPEDAMQACRPKCRPKCKIHAAVIEDDCAIESHDGSQRFIDRARPRVELIITPARRLTTEIKPQKALPF